MAAAGSAFRLMYEIKRLTRMIKGMIFDFDGTLFDSMYIWDSAGETYLRSIGKEPAEDLQSTLKRMSLHQSAAYLKEKYGIPLSVEEIIGGIDRTVETFYLDTVMPRPGAAELLEALSQKGVRMCIATATERYMVEAALLRCGMRQFFSEIFTCAQVGSGKDQPLIFRRAMEHLGTDRGNTIVVEDAWHAIRTAKQDGFVVAAVYDAHESMQSRIRETADIYMTDFFDLDPLWKFASAE